MPLQELVCAKSTVKYKCFKHFRVSTILQFHMKNMFQVEKAISACKMLPEAVLEGQKRSQGGSLGLPLDSKQA